jgi:hypothetical protein
MGYIQEAFAQVVADRKAVPAPERWYVVLWEVIRWYGGPEEGGWYGNDNVPIEYGEFKSEAEAEEVAERVKERAEELNRLTKRSHGERCLAELEWLDARGLDADYLPESDESYFYVSVQDDIPKAQCGQRGYC